MAYRAFRSNEAQAAAESAAPERFGDGTAWLALASQAESLGDVRSYSPNEWSAITGQAIPADTPAVVATQMWALRGAYEEARLAGIYVTLDGIEQLKDLRAAIGLSLRATFAPAAIKGGRAALYIIEQALNDPDRRRAFSQLIRDLDLQRAAIYRPPSRTPIVQQRAQARAAQAARPGPAQCQIIWEQASLAVAQLPHGSPEVGGKTRSELVAAVERRVMAAGCRAPVGVHLAIEEAGRW